jgi:hypothetical protein
MTFFLQLVSCEGSSPHWFETKGTGVHWQSVLKAALQRFQERAVNVDVLSNMRSVFIFHERNLHACCGRFQGRSFQRKN